MIIPSLLSQDLYKYSMLQIFFQKTPNATAKYRFMCRNKDVDLMPFKKEIENELDALCELRHSPKELEWLSKIRFFSPAFVDYLEDYTLKRRYIHVDETKGQLDIWAEGPLTAVSTFEIFTLKIVQEVYMRNVHPMTDNIRRVGNSNLMMKINSYNDFHHENNFLPIVVDFGGRRSYSVDWHFHVVNELSKAKVIVGTSDMHFARILDIKPIGTMAHEYICLFQALTHPMESQRMAFKNWLDFYGNDLGIVLSDNFGDKKFIQDFDSTFAVRFQGCRHDSGDPFKWGDMMIKHYQSFGIDPKEKVLVFSDGLDFQAVFKLQKYFQSRIKVSFGIGTWLTNDISLKPLQNVFKLIEVNGYPVAKVSNNLSKSMCEDQNYMNYLIKCLDKI